MEKIRVVVADDSAFCRSFLRHLLEEDVEIQVIAEAKNGKEALRLVQELKPSLITIDLEMPVMDGLTAIKEIMATCAVPILVVSTSTSVQKTYAALSLGALDAIVKPQIDTTDGSNLISKIKLLSKIKVITHLRSRTIATPTQFQPPLLDTTYSPTIFALAASTGGPQALATILSSLPAHFPCPILIAQHTSDGFIEGMADWLRTFCPLPMQIVKSCQRLEPGHIYISPSEMNLTVLSTGYATLTPRQPNEVYRPNCNALLSSLAHVYERKSAGIILSGMGNDGAQGMLQIHQAGGSTLAQDESSSIIFGMNKIAIEMGGIQQVLPVHKIASAMCRLAGLSQIENAA